MKTIKIALENVSIFHIFRLNRKFNIFIANDSENPYGIDYSKVNMQEVKSSYQDNPYGSDPSHIHQDQSNYSGSFQSQNDTNFNQPKDMNQFGDQQHPYNDQFNQLNQNFGAVNDQYDFNQPSTENYNSNQSPYTQSDQFGNCKLLFFTKI